MHQDIVGWDSRDINLGSPVLVWLNFSFLRIRCPAPWSASPHSHNQWCRRGATPGLTAECYEAPKGLAECPARISFNQREKTDLCGNEIQKLGNILELSQMLNPERKRETPGIGRMSLVRTIELHIYMHVYIYSHVFMYMCIYLFHIS